MAALPDLQKSLTLPVKARGILAQLLGDLFHGPPYAQAMHGCDVCSKVLALEDVEIEGEGLVIAGCRSRRRTFTWPANVHMMVQRRAMAAGIQTKLSCHSFRPTGITTYLQNGGKLEVAQQMAGHESARTTGLYDRRNDSVALDEVERIAY